MYRSCNINCPAQVVPQGSILGPIFLTCYTAPLGDIFRRHNLQYHMYDDECQIYVLFRPGETASHQAAVDRMERCISDVRTWMRLNFLKLNDSKTELMIFGTRSKLYKVPSLSLEVGETKIESSETTRNLGVTFDPEMNMVQRINNVCRVSYMHLRNIGCIRKFLTTDATKALVNAYVTSRRDYGNALLAGLPSSTISKLQRVQNTAARIISLPKRNEHISPVLQDFHWLPIASRIKFKIMLYAYKSLHGQAPQYLADMLQTYQPTRYLRSAEPGLLCVPKTRLATYGETVDHLIRGNQECFIREATFHNVHANYM